MLSDAGSIPAASTNYPNEISHLGGWLSLNWSPYGHYWAQLVTILVTTFRRDIKVFDRDFGALLLRLHLAGLTTIVRTLVMVTSSPT